MQTGGFIECHKGDSISGWKSAVGLGEKFTVENLQNFNIANWERLTGYRGETVLKRMPKMLQLTFDKKNEYIPLEYVVTYSCSFLTFSKKGPCCENPSGNQCVGKSFYGYTEGNKRKSDNNLLCKDQCRKYKRYFGNYACTAETHKGQDKHLYCTNCRNLNREMFHFNLFEILRQLTVTSCMVKDKKVLPYILNPVTQTPFSSDEINNFPKMFSQAHDSYLTTQRVKKGKPRSVAEHIAKYGSPASLGATALTAVGIGGPLSIILLTFATLSWSVGYANKLYDLIELDRDKGAWNHMDKKAFKATAKVAFEASKGLIFSIINVYGGIDATGLDAISSSFGELAKSGYSSGYLGLEFYEGILEKLVFAGYDMAMYRANKFEEASKKGDASDLSTFDRKLNSMILKREKSNSKKLPLTLDFLNDPQSAEYLKHFCVLYEVMERFKLLGQKKYKEKGIAKAKSKFLNLRKSKKSTSKNMKGGARQAIRCGAKTKSGGKCARPMGKNGGKCHLHN